MDIAPAIETFVQTLWSTLTSDATRNLATVIGTLVASFVTISTFVMSVLKPLERFRVWRDLRTLKRLRSSGFNDQAKIRESVRYYILPEGTAEDPSADDKFRYTSSLRAPLVANLDRLIRENENRFIFILADSGMGKSSFLLYYYARHHRRLFRPKPYSIELFPLGEPGVDLKIKNAKEDCADTVLLLDALDEDRAAIEDLPVRLANLLQLTGEFRTVVITCRTQFFSNDNEIPTETGILKHGPIKGGESRMYRFHRLYLAPFSNQQIEAYLRRRYSVLRIRRRFAARRIVKSIPDLIARPMLLAHVEDLLQSKQQIRFACDAYELMLEAWLAREDYFFPREKLRTFSEKLAVEIFTNRRASGYRMPGHELQAIADTFGINLESWQLRGRSLLNRNAEGEYKFAHRSIMEYLVAKQILAGQMSPSMPVSDMVNTFVREILSTTPKWNGLNLEYLDLSNMVLTNRNFAGCNLNRTNLAGSYLRGVNLTYATIVEADLSNVDLSFADLMFADLRQANLTGANLHGVNLTHAKLKGARAEDALLRAVGNNRSNEQGLKLRNTVVDLEVYERLKAIPGIWLMCEILDTTTVAVTRLRTRTTQGSL